MTILQDYISWFWSGFILIFIIVFFELVQKEKRKAFSRWFWLNKHWFFVISSLLFLMNAVITLLQHGNNLEIFLEKNPSIFLRQIIYYFVPSFLMILIAVSEKISEHKHFWKFLKPFQNKVRNYHDKIEGVAIIVLILFIWGAIDQRLIDYTESFDGNFKYPSLMLFGAVVFALIICTGWNKFDLKCNLEDLIFLDQWKNLFRPSKFKLFFNLKNWKLMLEGFIFTAIIGIALIYFLDVGYFHIKPFMLKHPFQAIFFYPLSFFCSMAMVEEIFFRLILQDIILEQWLKRKTWQAILIASLVFGASHLNNGDSPLDFSHWQYAILPTFGGIIFGIVYKKTNSTLVAAILHATIIYFMFGFLIP